MLIEITQQCSYKCKHCLCDSDPTKTTYMSKELFEKSLCFAIENGVYALVISGGDPLMHPNFFEFMERIPQLYDSRAIVTICTNGWWIENEDIVSKLKDLTKELKQYTEFHIQVSTNKKYYPKYSWTISHRKDYEKINNCELVADWQDSYKEIKRYGRAKNLLRDEDIHSKPSCMNLVSYALSGRQFWIIDNLKLLLMFSFMRGKMCTPVIDWNGNIKISEGIDCTILANIKDYNPYSSFSDKLYKSIVSHVPCNDCHCMKNMLMNECEYFDKSRIEYGLEPKFVNLLDKVIHENKNS